MRHPDPGSEDPTVDLNTQGRQSENEWGLLPNNQGNLRGPAFDEAAAMSQGIDGAREPFGAAPTVVPVFIPASVSTSTPLSPEFGVDVEVEDPTADLDTRRRQSEKKESFIFSWAPCPKDSSSSRIC